LDLLVVSSGFPCGLICGGGVTEGEREMLPMVLLHLTEILYRPMQFQHFSLQKLAIYEIVIPDAPMLCIKTIITCEKKEQRKEEK